MTAPSAHEPARTCVGCRQRGTRDELARFVLVDGEVVADPGKSLPGRGAWLHDTDSCRALAERRRAFGRALRVRRSASQDPSPQA